MRETWYLLEDGTCVSPNEVSPDKAGVLRNKSGAAVAMRGHVPSTRGVDPDEEKAKGQPKHKDMKPDDHTKRHYRTRESKAD